LYIVVNYNIITIRIKKSDKKVMQIDFWNFLNKKRTVIGKFFWVINCILILFFVYFILSILLSPFHFLKDFIFAVVIILQFVFAVIMNHLKLQFKLFSFLDNIPIINHFILFLLLATTYYFSINHIWKNKKDYIN